MTMTNAEREAYLRLRLGNEVPVGGAYEDVGSGLRAAVTAGGLWVSLHSAPPGAAGTQLTNELAGVTEYARQELLRTFGAGGFDATLAATGVVTNTDDVLFPEVLTDPGPGIEALCVGMGTDETGAGNLLDYMPLGLEDPRLCVNLDSAVTDTLLCPGSNFAADARVMFVDVIGGTLPSGLSDAVAYYVINPTADTFQVSLTPSPGAAIDLGNGAAHVYRMNPQPITLGTIVRFLAGKLAWKVE